MREEKSVERLKSELQKSIQNYEKMRDSYQDMYDSYLRWTNNRKYEIILVKFVGLPLGVTAVILFAFFAVWLIALLLGFPFGSGKSF